MNEKTEAKRVEPEFECQRCGLCCGLFGEMFWIHGKFKGNMDLEMSAHALNHYNIFGSPKKACEFLNIVEGRMTCSIENNYGRAWKPELCKKYPKEGQKCFRQQIDEIKKEAQDFFESHRGIKVKQLPEPQPLLEGGQ